MAVCIISIANMMYFIIMDLFLSSKREFAFFLHLLFCCQCCDLAFKIKLRKKEETEYALKIKTVGL